MTCELDNILWQAWLKVRHNVLTDPLELRRRLDRRAKMYDQVPRPLCLAIKASDRRLTDFTLTTHFEDIDHEVRLRGRTIFNLCRPVELYWGLRFRVLARQLGADRQVPRRLEKRGTILGRRIALLGGQRGLPVALLETPVPATAPRELCNWESYGYPTKLDPGALGYLAPDKLLLPYWQNLSLRIRDDFLQTLTRTPIFRVQRGQRRFMHWAWLCPDCQRPVKTIYLPLGAPDFVKLHDIDLPVGQSYDTPEPHLCFACKRCHHLFNLARTPRSIAKSWGLLVAHLSGGLLFGHEVKRPAAFGAIRHNKPLPTRRPSPRRDELEAYLAHTDLPIKEIARRMNWTQGAIQKELHLICKKRHLKGSRPALKQYWRRHNQTAAA